MKHFEENNRKKYKNVDMSAEKIKDITADQLDAVLEKDLESAIPLLRHERVSPETLSGLSGHENYKVRYAVAGNMSTPIETVTKMTEDQDERVAERAKATLEKHKQTL